VRKTLVGFLCLFFIHYSGFGQDGNLPLDEQKNAVYSDVASLEQTKNVLFENAQKWVVKSFGNYENAVDSQDKASGKLVIKTYAPITSAAYEYLRFTMTIRCEENKYQVVVNDLEGIAKSQRITRLGKRQNDAILEKAVLVKTESSRRKKAVVENELEEMKADNERVSQTIYSLMASLKQIMIEKAGE